MKKMFKSKRFVSLIIGLILFIGLLVTTKFSPLDIAGGITMITSTYIGGETFRNSNNEEETG